MYAAHGIWRLFHACMVLLPMQAAGGAPACGAGPGALLPPPDARPVRVQEEVRPSQASEHGSVNELTGRQAWQRDPASHL